jgi:hypothetical protein
VKVYTSRGSVYEIGPNGAGNGFVAEKTDAPEGQVTRVSSGRRFESTILIINMEKGEMILEGLVLQGITRIES